VRFFVCARREKDTVSLGTDISALFGRVTNGNLTRGRMVAPTGSVAGTSNYLAASWAVGIKHSIY